MLWLTYLLSAVLAAWTPTHAASSKWTVLVGGATADTSIYANAFYPRTIEIGVGDTVTWTFEGFHNVAFLSGGAAPPLGVPEGDKTYWNPQMLFPAGDQSYDGTGYHTSGVPGPDGRLSYTLTFTKPGRYPYECTIGRHGDVDDARYVRDPHGDLYERGEATPVRGAGAPVEWRPQDSTQPEGAHSHEHHAV